MIDFLCKIKVLQLNILKLLKIPGFLIKIPGFSRFPKSGNSVFETKKYFFSLFF